jgi:ATP-binding cassette subfamily B protein
MHSFKIVYKTYIQHAKKYPWLLIGCFVFWGIGVIITNVWQPLVYKELVDILTATGTPSAEIWNVFLMLAGSLVFAFLLYRLADFTIMDFERKVIFDLQNDIFNRLLKHSYEFFTHQFTGSLVSNASKLVNSFEALFDTLIFTIWMGGIALISSIFVLFFVSPILAALFLTWLIVFAGAVYAMSKKQMVLNEHIAEAESKTTGTFADAVGNALSIKMFSGLQHESKYYRSVTGVEAENRRVTWNYFGFQYTVQSAMTHSFELIAIGIALYLWTINLVTPGAIVLMQIYVFRAVDRVWNMGKEMTRALTRIADAEVMARIISTPTSVLDPQNPEVPRISVGGIDIKNIYFSYGKNEPVFKNFTLTIAPGEKIGLVGHSGSGKSTITKLILRFLDVQRGSITIDGQDIKKITQDSLRSNIAYVPQDPLLFHRTIKENIMYGKPDATLEEVITVAQRAYAHEFISRLPQGYDTLVGERGVRLSGGERQRIAIARAMIKEAPILILDEATSALDSMSERYIKDAFKDLMKNKTSIVIAHRLSTIQSMDRIVVFDKGEIAEMGTHTELIKNKGVYAELWDEQTSGFIE